MDDLERSISERQDIVFKLEKEVSQANERLAKAQQELALLLAARQIVTMDGLANELSMPLPLVGVPSPSVNSLAARFAASPNQPTIKFSMSNGTVTIQKPGHEMTLVDEVKEILCHTPCPIGPAQIRAELAKTGRDVPQNVMTGLLSRLWKEQRVVRLERGKYLAKTDEVIIGKRETA